jgi:hypothetical protein
LVAGSVTAPSPWWGFFLCESFVCVTMCAVCVCVCVCPDVCV